MAGHNKFSIMLVFKILSAALVILSFSWLYGKFNSKAVKNIENVKYISKAFFYEISLFLLPISIIILLFVSLINIPLAIFVTFAYISLIFFSKSITSFISLHWLNYKYELNQCKVIIFFVSLGVYIITYILKLIPIIGVLVGLSITCIASRVIIIEYRKNRTI